MSSALVRYEIDSDQVELKHCSRCGETFPATSEYFHKKKDGKYGLNCYCKECNKARALAHHYENREARLGYLTEYREQNREKLRQYKRNPDKKRASDREYYWANVDRKRDQARQYYQIHKAAFVQRAMEWSKKNPEKAKAYTRVKALRRRGAPLDAISREYVSIISRDVCVYCGSSGDIVIDHIHPISNGGTSEWTNLAPSCRSCNAAKTNKSLLSYLLERIES